VYLPTHLLSQKDVITGISKNLPGLRRPGRLGRAGGPRREFGSVFNAPQKRYLLGKDELIKDKN
jgi:hypothetical protein